jgi:hypothetical protein
MAHASTDFGIWAHEMKVNPGLQVRETLLNYTFPRVHAQDMPKQS